MTDAAAGNPSLRLLPVILAGGVGARLAPLSTPERPKPFIPLADGESLLTKTLARVHDPRFLPPLLIGRAADRFALLNHARAAGVKPVAILLESNGCNTGPAVALAARWAQQHYGEDCQLVVLPADHAIAPEEAWRATVLHGMQASIESNSLCLLTATPTRNERDFGYAVMAPSSAARLWQRVEHFVEKPADPASVIAHGARWNMGQFIGSAAQFMSAFAKHAPHYAHAAEHALRAASQHWEFTEIPSWPASLESASFDRAVLEHVSSVAVPFTGHWQDLGHLEAWWAFTGLDQAYYARLPARIDRPWGYFEQQASGNNELYKRLVLYPDSRLSRQRHQKRAEQWRVLSGTAYVELGDAVQRLEKGEEITIPAGSWHRLANHHTDILIIQEKQMGICEESDIERAEDDYGRN